MCTHMQLCMCGPGMCASLMPVSLSAPVFALVYAIACLCKYCFSVNQQRREVGSYNCPSSLSWLTLCSQGHRLLPNTSAYQKATPTILGKAEDARQPEVLSNSPAIHLQRLAGEAPHLTAHSPSLRCHCPGLPSMA